MICFPSQVVNGLVPDGRALMYRGREEAKQYTDNFGIKFSVAKVSYWVNKILDHLNIGAINQVMLVEIENEDDNMNWNKLIQKHTPSNYSYFLQLLCFLMHFKIINFIGDYLPLSVVLYYARN